MGTMNAPRKPLNRAELAAALRDAQADKNATFEGGKRVPLKGARVIFNPPTKQVDDPAARPAD